MTEDGKYLSKADFLENATEKDYEDLWNFYQLGTKNFPTKKDPKPDCKYQFSDASARELLKEWKQRKEEQEKEDTKSMEEGKTGNGAELQFSQVKLAFGKRSLQITDDHWNRLQKLYDKYPVINKNYVLQAALEELLTRYGV